MRRLSVVGLVLLAASVLPLRAIAEGNMVDHVVLAADVVHAVFNGEEQAVLDAYLEDSYQRQVAREQGADKKFNKGKQQKPLPKGLQKKLDRGGQLPPGWQKKVERGEVLGVDIYRQARPLPERYLSQLEHQPAGTSVLQVDDRIIRVHDATRTIVDVFFPAR